MTTLIAIGFTVAGGSVVLTACLGLFGFAVSRQSPLIAPRAAARPPSVIHNPHAPPGHVQYRGGTPFNPLGWVRWCQKLSYETLLQGVPGTGTRQGGLRGTLLHVTLDGIVLLRFHALGRKVALVATALCCGLLLPLYATAPCVPVGSDDPRRTHFYYWAWYECNATLTTFRQTTLSHVPDLKAGTAFSASGEDYSSPRLALRLYVVVMVLWIVTLYALHLLRQEWVDLLALRRVHYLEQRGGEKASSQEWCHRLSHRRTPSDADESSFSSSEPPSSHGGALEAPSVVAAAAAALAATAGRDGTTDLPSTAGAAPSSADPVAASAEPHLIHRPPWIPHPEQPDTVPNVEPYSILVGHLPWPPEPSSPNSAAKGLSHGARSNGGGLVVDEENGRSSRRDDVLDSDDDDVEFDDSGDDVDECDDFIAGGPSPECPSLTFAELAKYQLGHLARLLEAALPQEPGYSSPIAAATIVPPSDGMGKCWRRWYSAASALRRHEYLQAVYAERTSTYGTEDDDVDDHFDANGDVPRAERFQLVAGEPSFQDHPSPTSSTRISPPSSPRRLLRQVAEDGAPSSPPAGTGAHRLRRPSRYLRQVFGCHPALADAAAFDPATDLRADVLGLGPEQLAVYSRELAQSAAPCGPHGFREGVAWTLPLAELRDAVADAEWRVRQSVQDLHRARQCVAERPLYWRRSRRRRRNRNRRKGRRLGPVRHFDFSRCYRRPKPVPPSPGALELTDVSLNQEARRNKTPTTPSPQGRSSGSNDADGERSDANGSPRVNATSPRWGLEEWTAPLRDLRERQWWRHAWSTWRHLRTFQTYGDDLFRRENSYAVLTFTSRQTAAAARQFVSSHRELTLHDIPIPPLADAAPCTLLPCRFFCRPVSVSVTDWQKNVRLYLILAWLGLMYTFYTIPLTFATSQFDPDTIAYLFPEHSIVSDSIGVNVPELISGLASSIIWSFFFMMCPQVFKLIAYFGSRATSLAQAERRAMQYFWWFMVLTAFTGPMLAYWILGAVNKSQKLGDGLRDVLIRVAGSTPTLIAANWLNWIIYRFTIILPINFLLQFNTFLFSFLGFRCCSRLTIGGGPGGPIPYRIFVDSSVVLMCTFALAPSSPLVAPASFAYFCFCEPLLRRNLIFVYRPRYDDGGLRWVSVFDMTISALVVGQILLAIQMGLKNAFGPGLIAAMAIPVTIWFQWYCKRKFDPAFENTALLRTSLIDGWESLDNMTLEHREGHLRFLVDAHKAAYVPVCIAGSDAAPCITTEPAVAVPHSIIDSDSEHSERPLKSRRPSSQTGGELPGRDAPASTALFDSGDGMEAISWLESALEPDDLVGAFNRFRLGSQKSE